MPSFDMMHEGGETAAVLDPLPRKVSITAMIESLATAVSSAQAALEASDSTRSAGASLQLAATPEDDAAITRSWSPGAPRARTSAARGASPPAAATAARSASFPSGPQSDDAEFGGLGRGLGRLMRRNAERAAFGTLRSSLTGEATEQPPAVDVRERLPFVTPCNLPPEDAKPGSAGSDESMDTDAAAVPERFRRVRSARLVRHERPDSAAVRRQAQLNRLPIAYQESYDKHIINLRTLLEPGVWEKVQQSMDWSDWNEDEKLAALSKVVIPLEDDVVLNDLDEGPKPAQLAVGPARSAIARRREEEARAAEKRRRSGACDVEVIANYGGIAVKRPVGLDPRTKLNEVEAMALLEALRAERRQVRRSDGVVPTPSLPPADSGPIYAAALLAPIPKIASPSLDFWDALETNVAESVRQASHGVLLRDLLLSIQQAVDLTARQQRMDGLVESLFARQAAAIRIQAHWRGFVVRRWYRDFRKSAEFRARQDAYEEQLRTRWEAEEAAAQERAERAAARKQADEKKRVQEYSLVASQRSRFMQSAKEWALLKSQGRTLPREQMSKEERKQLGSLHLKAALALARPVAREESQPTEATLELQLPPPSSLLTSANLPPPSPGFTPGQESLDRLGLDPENLELRERLLAAPPRPGSATSDSTTVSKTSAATSRTATTSVATTTRRGRAKRVDRGDRGAWMLSQHPAMAETEVEARTIDESMATHRLAERRKARQERREAAKRMAAMRPEERAEAMSEEERVERRIQVLEQVLGPAVAQRFRDTMVANQRGRSAAAAGRLLQEMPSINLRAHTAEDESELARAAAGALAALEELSDLPESPREDGDLPRELSFRGLFSAAPLATITESRRPSSPGQSVQSLAELAPFSTMAPSPKALAGDNPVDPRAYSAVSGSPDERVSSMAEAVSASSADAPSDRLSGDMEVDTALETSLAVPLEDSPDLATGSEDGGRRSPEGVWSDDAMATFGDNRSDSALRGPGQGPQTTQPPRFKAVGGPPARQSMRSELSEPSFADDVDPDSAAVVQPASAARGSPASERSIDIRGSQHLHAPAWPRDQAPAHSLKSGETHEGLAYEADEPTSERVPPPASAASDSDDDANSVAMFEDGQAVELVPVDAPVEATFAMYHNGALLKQVNTRELRRGSHGSAPGDTASRLMALNLDPRRDALAEVPDRLLHDHGAEQPEPAYDGMLPPLPRRRLSHNESSSAVNGRSNTDDRSSTESHPSSWQILAAVQPASSLRTSHATLPSLMQASDGTGAAPAGRSSVSATVWDAATLGRSSSLGGRDSERDAGDRGSRGGSTTRRSVVDDLNQKITTLRQQRALSKRQSLSHSLTRR